MNQRKFPAGWEIRHFLELRWPSLLILIANLAILFFCVQAIRGIYLPQLSGPWHITGKVLFCLFLFGGIASILDDVPIPRSQTWEGSLTIIHLVPFVFAIASPLASVIRGRYRRYNLSLLDMLASGPIFLIVVIALLVIFQFTKRPTSD